MPFSEFSRLFKCASMLSAQEKLDGVNIANFSNLAESDRKKLSRQWRTASSEYLEKKVKDYREVFAGIARRMMSGSR